MRLVFLDLETGGLDPSRHPITQIAAIAVDERLNELETFEAKIDFDMAAADQEALLKNNFDREVWARESRPDMHVCNELSRFFKRYADVEMISKAGKPYSVAQLIGHNADKFDGPFLQAWFKRLDQFMPAAFSVMCTYQKARHHFFDNQHLKQPPGFKLGELCAHYGIPLANAHDALADCRANVAIYRAMQSESSQFKQAIDHMLPWALIGLAESHSAVQFARSLGIASQCAIDPEEQKLLQEMLDQYITRKS